MAYCFSIVDNFDGKFVRAIIKLPFTGDFVTDGWITSANMFIKWNNSTMNFWRNFFSKSWASKLGVQLICECGLDAGVYSI